MPRRRVVEDPVSHERWLVSYADFITLLFAFFVVMYSISQVNEGKYKVLSQTLSKAFTATQLDSGQSEPELNIDPFQVGELAKSNPLNVIEMQAPIVEQQQGEQGANQQALPGDFRELSDKLETFYGDLIESDLVKLRGNEEWLEVELKSSLLFDSGDARINPRALELLGGIAELLKGQNNPVRVEGFTDNVPISTAKFPSNWELSTARAAAVVQLFVEEGLDPSRFAAIGYGEHQPIADNSTAEGRTENRRVVLMISKTGELRPSLREVTSAEQLKAAAPAEQPTGIRIEIPGVKTEPEPEPVEAPETPPEQPAPTEMQGIKTIELEDGGLLFTRDREQDGDE